MERDETSCPAVKLPIQELGYVKSHAVARQFELATFACLAVYVADRIVLILRDKCDETADNGVWLATT
jgi:hypothetical protein